VKSKILIFTSVIILTGYTACKKSSVKNINEGEIHYNIIYNGRVGSIPIELMPGRMVVKFKDSKTMFELTSPIGNNGISNIIDPQEKTVETYIRMLGMKYLYTGSINDVPPGIDPMPDMILNKTDRTAEILGLKCKHAIAELPGSDFRFDLWYTDEISIDDPNYSTPFREIDGVLISFFYRMGEMIVEFEADGVYMRPITDKDFQKTEKFRQISRDDMDSIISTMMSL